MTVLRCTPRVSASVRLPGSAWPGRRRPRAMSRATAWEMRTNSGAWPPVSRARGRSGPRMTGRSYFTELDVSALPVVGQDLIHEPPRPFHRDAADPGAAKPGPGVLRPGRRPGDPRRSAGRLGRLRPGRPAVRHPDGGGARRGAAAP